MKDMYKLALANVILLASISVHAQSELKKANRLYEKLDYSLAITHYLEHFKKHDPDAASAVRLATCYRMNNGFEEAESWYEKALILGNNDPGTLWYYAEILRSNGKYSEAKDQYIQYGKLDPSVSDRVASKIKACDEAVTWMSSPALYEVSNVEAMNSESADFCPVLFGNGMVFASDRVLDDDKNSRQPIHGWSGRPYVKLYYAEQEKIYRGSEPIALAQKGPAADSNVDHEMRWKEAKLLSASMGEYHNGPAAFDAKSNKMFFTRTRKVQVKTGEKYPDPTGWQRRSTGNYINRLEIFIAERNDTGWADIMPFQYNNAEEYSVGHPALSPDGKVLYFTSDMPGGYGETDIYYCELKDNGTWSRPMNAGQAINTSGREGFPVVSADGVLYFSSDGHAGMGGLDIFSAKGSRGSWDDVMNLRLPFNSAKDDMGIVFTKGDEEGYFSSDREGGKGLDDIYSFKKIRPQSPPPTVPASVKLIFPAVYFDFDKANIRSDAAQALDRVVAALKENPEVKVEVSAHCDCRGSHSYNTALSAKRAASAFNYLVAKGIDKSRLTAKGYGENRPVNGCTDGIECSEEQHQQNRRTEFSVIEEGKKVLD